MRNTVNRNYPFVLVLLFCLLSPSLLQAGWKAGTAKIQITPETPLWMAGYAARTEPSKGTFRELYAKALALEDETGQQSVLITMDILGFSSTFIEAIAEKASSRTGIPRERFLFNASHTHSGPALSGVLEVAYDMSPEQARNVRSYTEQLQNRLLELVLDAVNGLRPAKLSYGSTTASFGVNRRVKTDSGYVGGVNRQGPVDHKVPFLVIDNVQGSIRAVLFGYSCHNTTLQGNNYHFHGDYAGVAQAGLEERYPDSLAMFITGTAGDTNPYPRGTRELAEEHGKSLASSVDQALTGPLKKVSGQLKADLSWIPLDFAKPLTRGELVEKTKDEDHFVRKNAEFFLKLLEEEGRIPDSYLYPVQVWRFGPDLSLVALAGEVVVDYSIRLKEELKDSNLWVAGYSNDVSFYVPSRRILAEGGYEAEGSMIYYCQPGPFAPSVEDLIVGKVKEIYGDLAVQENK